MTFIPSLFMNLNFVSSVFGGEEGSSEQQPKCYQELEVSRRMNIQMLVCSPGLAPLVH